MKVIASIKYEDRKSRSRRITVRKCPPNYKPQEGEYVVELEDYTREDIKNYFYLTRMRRYMSADYYYKPVFNYYRKKKPCLKDVLTMSYLCPCKIKLDMV